MFSISLTWSFFHCHLLPIAVTLIPPSYHTEMLLSSCKMACVILSSQGDCTHCFLTKALSILYSLTIYFIVYIQHWSASSIKLCGYLPIRVIGLTFTKWQNVSGIAHAFLFFSPKTNISNLITHINVIYVGSTFCILVIDALHRHAHPSNLCILTKCLVRI